MRTGTAPLRRIATVFNGGTPTSDAVNWGGDVPWATPNDLAKVDGTLLGATERTLTTVGLKAGSAQVPAGSLILSTRAPIGYVAVTDRPMAFNQGCRGIVPGPQSDGRYLRYHLWSRREALHSLGTGSTFQELGTDSLEGFPVPVPPLAEQRRIADFLDDQIPLIDATLRSTEHQASLVTERTSAAIRRELLPGTSSIMNQPPWFDDLPEKWVAAPLRAHWQVIDCKHLTPQYVESGFPVVSPGDITPGRLDLSRAHRFVNKADYLDLADELRRCRPGDIVYSRNASAGTAALVEDRTGPFTMGQDVCRITSSQQSQVYLLYALNFLVRPQLDSARVGSTFTRINIDRIKGLRVAVPPSIDQKRIGESCDQHWEAGSRIRSALARQISLLQERKRALITAAVTGEFDVSTASGRNTA